MRMHPGVSYPLERVVPRGGAELCGTYLPEGTVVGVNAAVIHRNRDIFGHDADHFRPERWLEGSEEKIKEMDRNLLTVRIRLSFVLSVRVEMKLSVSAPTIVWSGHSNVHRKEYLHHGGRQICASDAAAIQRGMGIERARVASDDLLVCQTDRPDGTLLPTLTSLKLANCVQCNDSINWIFLLDAYAAGFMVFYYSTSKDLGFGFELVI